MNKQMIMLLAEQIALDKWAVALDRFAKVENAYSGLQINELPSYRELEAYLTEECGL